MDRGKSEFSKMDLVTLEEKGDRKTPKDLDVEINGHPPQVREDRMKDILSKGLVGNIHGFTQNVIDEASASLKK